MGSLISRGCTCVDVIALCQSTARLVVTTTMDQNKGRKAAGLVLEHNLARLDEVMIIETGRNCGRQNQEIGNMFIRVYFQLSLASAAEVLSQSVDNFLRGGLERIDPHIPRKGRGSHVRCAITRRRSLLDHNISDALQFLRVLHHVALQLAPAADALVLPEQQLEQQHVQQSFAARVVELDGPAQLVSVVAEDGIEERFVTERLAGLGVRGLVGLTLPREGDRLETLVLVENTVDQLAR